MVCKNCGADLKPGIKYCLNCGNYIEEDDEEKVDEGISFDELNDSISSESEDSITNFQDSFDEIVEEKIEKPVKKKEKTKKKKKKKYKIQTTDILIYGGLLFVIIVSLVIMVVYITKDNKKTGENPINDVKLVDNEVKVDNYSVKFSGDLSYSQEGSSIYVTDGSNYSFSYRNATDDYEKYEKDLTILSKNLEKSGYDVLSTEKKNVSSSKFIVYKYKDVNSTKYLYLTRVNTKYVSMGVIDPINNGDWEKSLTVINDMNKSIKFDDSEDEINQVISNATSSLSKILSEKNA